MPIGWNNIQADFGGVNSAMTNALKGISNAGTVFGELRKSILDQEQKEIENAYKERELAERARQFGLTHQLNEDKLAEQIRSNDLANAYHMANLEESSRHNKAVEAYHRGQLGLAQAAAARALQDKENRIKAAIDAYDATFGLVGQQNKERSEVERDIAGTVTGLQKLQEERASLQNALQRLNAESKDIQAINARELASRNQQQETDSMDAASLYGNDDMSMDIDALRQLYQTPNASETRRPIQLNPEYAARQLRLEAIPGEAADVTSRLDAVNAQITDAERMLDAHLKRRKAADVPTNYAQLQAIFNKTLLDNGVLPGTVRNPFDQFVQQGEKIELQELKSQASGKKGSNGGGSSDKKGSGILNAGTSKGSRLSDEFAIPYQDFVIQLKDTLRSEGLNISDRDLNAILFTQFGKQEESIANMFPGENTSEFQNVSAKQLRTWAKLPRDSFVRVPKIKAILDRIRIYSGNQSNSDD